MDQFSSSNDKPKFYLTTPIYYANSRPHVGSAYTTIVCDVIARYKRMCGYDVAYLTGTDEHGVNIERAAEKAGITPQELVDKNEKIFRDLWKLLGISDQPYFNFVRTHSPEHERAVQTLVRRTIERDRDKAPDEKSIFKKKYEGRYCIYDNAYVSDTPEPVNCPTCGRPAELISEENYFFRLSAYQDKLLQLYKDKPDFVQPDFRMNEVRSFVESGLKDVSISRKTIKWGIPWPGDPEHVFYVWYDALTSYMTGIGYASDDEERAKRFQKYWMENDSYVLHVIGKEIIRFHAVYWPAFLMAAELPLPKQILAHGWLLFEQEKMSKSKGNVAYPEPIVKVLGNDALRYYLLRETVFGQDGNFSREALITRYNADLANGLGNLASRVLTMIQQYFDAQIPPIDPPENDPSRVWSPGDRGVRLHGIAEGIQERCLAAFGRFDFSGALGEIWFLVGQIDLYLSEVKPWVLAADATRNADLRATLYRAAAWLRVAVALSHPIIPDATLKMWKQIGENSTLEDFNIKEVKWSDLKPGTRIGKLEAVFPRADKKEVSERIEAMENEIRNPGSTQPAAETAPSGAGAAAAPAAAPVNAKITIEDFAKVELRVGVVKSAERIQGADRLLKVLVDIGDEVRQVLAGIALAYTPEELVGRKVVVVTNLAPRKMRGLESNGMLLAASAEADGKPVLCTFAEEIPAGAKVK
jgi:methionyl-tRNA synthetase